MLRLDPRNVAAFGNRGRAFLLRGETARAVEDFSRLLQLEPGNLRALADRAAAYMDLGKADRAIADYTEAIRLAPTAALLPRPRHRPRGRRQPRRRRRRLRRGAGARPARTSAPCCRAATPWPDRTSSTRAAADFAEAIRIEPRGPTARLRRAGVLARQRALRRGAGRPRRRSCRSTRTAPPPTSSAPACTRSGAKYALAVADFTEVIRLDPRSVAAYLRRAECHARLGDDDRALADYDQALAFDAIDVPPWPPAPTLRVQGRARSTARSPT